MEAHSRTIVSQNAVVKGTRVDEDGVAVRDVREATEIIRR